MWPSTKWEVATILHFSLLERVPVFPLESIAGREGGFAIIIFPHLFIARYARRAAERMLFENVSFVVAIQFHEARLLASIHSIRQDD